MDWWGIRGLEIGGYSFKANIGEMLLNLSSGFKSLYVAVVLKYDALRCNFVHGGMNKRREHGISSSTVAIEVTVRERRPCWIHHEK
ncbi:hypothetical protein AVEN_218939-1 [Araneus ventricosus]|uniref:Uncharacterized protein n=1 Tax=Araneus ventricosus TaxID=182803 RepID=A0A4Y2H4E4_ARAVE|nr:hypothetical protein AVEN_218939-1 [Araneus ventricosus]